MKKLFLLISCFAVVLVLSNVSFAAEEAAACPAAPCVCSNCDCAAFPFDYPPQRFFGGKFAAFAGKCPLGHRAPQALPCFEPCAPEACAPAPYPYPYSNAYLRAVRRVARLAPPPVMPYPVPAPRAMAVPRPRMMAPPPVAAAAAPPAMPTFAANVGQTGKINYMSQKASAPVINFLSVVRGGPRSPYDPYAGYYPAEPCPCQKEAAQQ